MDLSPEYIKMCEKATPYYCPNWKWQHGDFCYSFYHKRIGTVDETAQYMKTPTLSLPLDSNVLTYDVIIPLPRQDQLQAMSRLSWREFDRLCQIYNEPTKEQAAIKATMHELYQKKWNGEDWIKEV